jgi:hypothetical protein
VKINHTHIQKKSIKNKVFNNTLWSFAIILPIIIFSVLLRIDLPPALIKIIKNQSVFTFFAVFGLYFLCFQLKGKAMWFACLLLTLIVFAVPLAYLWHSGYSDTKVIGSFIPYKDGFYFYNGARTLLLGHRIANGWNDVLRPLFPGMLASLLFFSDNNLLLTIALLVLGMGICSFLAALQAKTLFGTWPAALFMTYMVFYSRPFIGYTLSEPPGFILACMAFILLLRGVTKQKMFELSLGVIVLVFALSVRAGALFILPGIAIWSGLAFRKNKIFDRKTFLVIFLSMSFAFVIANIVIPRFLVESSNSTLGNFAYSLYGQAKGGVGTIQGIHDVGTTDPSKVLRGALSVIYHHPLGIIIGTLNAYRDFFIPNNYGIFDFIAFSSQTIKYLFWIFSSILMLGGIVHCVRNVKKPIYSFLLTCFLGLLASLPFAPPVGNGSRLYAGSIPLFFIPVSLGLIAIWNKKQGIPSISEDRENAGHFFITGFSIMLLSITCFMPVLIRYLSVTPKYSVAECPASQVPFAVQFFPGSFVEIKKIDEKMCGMVPNLCLRDFEINDRDKVNDDFYRELVQRAQQSKNGIRISASVDLVSFYYFFFVATPDLLPSTNPQGLISGCATRIDSQTQRVLWIESINK